MIPAMSDSSSTDVNSPDARIDRLEMRIADQDATIEALNQVLTEQWKQLDALTHQLALLNDRLTAAESDISPPTGNEPPPHY